MSYNKSSKLWPAADEHFFRDRTIKPQAQSGPTCVATVLAMLTGKTPADFIGRMNTQDPVSWSDVMRPYGMKLAYCPHDVRKLRHYLPELLAHDDLFTLSYYSPADPSILNDPNPETGWICGSHIVIMHRGKIIDPAGGHVIDAAEHHGMTRYTKRIFRAIPADHPRGL